MSVNPPLAPRRLLRIDWDVRLGDVPTLMPGIHVADRGADACGVSSPQGVAVELEGVGRGDVLAVLDAIDGHRTVEQIAQQLGEAEDPTGLQALLERLVGRAIILPQVTHALSQRIAPFAIVRYPGQWVYWIPRRYWSNMADLRQECSQLGAHVGRGADLRRYLQHLHRTAAGATRGPHRRYRGMSGAARDPGRWRDFSVRCRAVSSGTLACAHLAGELLGDPYHAHTRGGGSGARHLWGVDVGGMSARDEYLHPDPDPETADREQQIDAWADGLARSLSAALHAAPGQIALASIAAFHQLMCCLHPFYAINNALAMVIVDVLLERAQMPAISHYYLEEFAFRLSPAGYAEVFAALVTTTGLPRVEPPAGRLAENASLYRMLDGETLALSGPDTRRHHLRQLPLMRRLER